MSLISGNAIFGGDAVNCSSNSISGLAVFFGTATNAGNVTSAVFNDGAVNCGSITSGTFLGTAINSGSVNVAEFFGTASNAGFVVESAKFADTSSNVGTVSGSAIFADTSISDGVVEGAVQLGVNVTEGENQALTETPTEYTQTDGFFPNAHYSSGSKAAPANYETVVHQVGGFWYKYDGNGDGSLASGNYSDGTSMFTFVNGIKGAAYTPSYNVLSSYYYAGTLTSGVTVLYSDNTLTTLASSVTPFVVAGVAIYSTDGSGVVTIENITALGSYYYVGTLTNGTTVLYSNDSLTTIAYSIAPFVVAGVAAYSTTINGVVIIENIETINSYYYAGTLTNGTVLYADDGLTTLASSITPFVVVGVGMYSTDGSGVVTIENITALGPYYYVGTLTNGTTVLYADDSLTTLASNITPFLVAGVAAYSTNGSGVVTIENITALGSYYYLGTLTNGTTVLYSDDSLVTPASNITPFVVAGVAMYSTNGSGVVTIENIETIDSYYYAGTLTSGTTVLYTDDGLTTLASNITPFVVNSVARYSTDNSGVVIIENIAGLSSYYYAGTLTSGTTVLYSDDSLVTPAFDITPFVVAGVAIYSTNGSGVVTIENITALGSYYYLGTLTNGTTVLYNNDSLTTTASNITPFVVAGVARYSTDNIAVVIIENITALDSYYYTGTLTSGSTVLYSDNGLTTLASNIAPFVVAGVARYSTNGNGVVTIENIVSVAFGGTTYYHSGTFGDGTELHTTDALNALAVSIGPINMGDISDPVDGFNDSFSTNELGVVTITYGESSSLSTTINDVTYYYTGTLTSGSTVLYDDDALTTVASATRYAYTGSGATLYTIDNSGVYTAEYILNTSINSVMYYYTGTLANGTTLYNEIALTSTVNDLFYYYNDANENTDALYTTDGAGILNIQEAFQVTINGTTYRYVGTLTSGSTILRDNSTFDPVGAFSYVDTSASRVYSANGSGVYYEEIVYSISLNSNAYYYSGTLADGTILYSNDALNMIAQFINLVNIGTDLNNDGFTESLSTDAYGVVSIVYGTE